MNQNIFGVDKISKNLKLIFQKYRNLKGLMHAGKNNLEELVEGHKYLKSVETG